MKRTSERIWQLSAGVALTLCLATASATSRRTVYSIKSPDTGNSARSAEEALAERFTIVPVSANEQFVRATFTKRTLHPYIREPGRVTIAAVADIDGRLRDPLVLESTNPRLHLMMLNSVKNHWKCEPARLNGTPVPSVTQSTIDIRWRKPALIY